ncbi:uncharacterized protein N7518_003769 [Penicillium psychrosexuale]|uniref:uncharacterized protein n=1 Tax=Penicillium psychrosexuale TaxID=1002107 RepID=UPI002545B6F7|nr:uncharacterized protein N7518_003769 [Penicillium psychrosexuale]KAJ5801701.1 hypothetical protein N7518_003769 [Penicillium psychrosexuale]
MSRTHDVVFRYAPMDLLMNYAKESINPTQLPNITGFHPRDFLISILSREEVVKALNPKHEATTNFNMSSQYLSMEPPSPPPERARDRCPLCATY